jgi:hypothetical protein
MHGEHVGNFLNPYEFSCKEYEAAKEASYDVYPDCKFSTRLLLKADNVAATTKFAGTPYASATVHNATRRLSIAIMSKFVCAVPTPALLTI